MAETLPLFDKRAVQDSGQTPGYLQVSYSPDSFGASVGRALVQLGDTSMNIAKTQTALDSQRKANDALNYVQKAKDELRPLQFDPNVGIYAQQGGNAMGSGATINAAVENIQQKYLGEIKDPETQRVFQKLWDGEKEQAKDGAARHEMNELGAYKVQTAKTVLLGSITDAYNNYNNPEALKKALDSADTAIEVNAMGLDPQSLAAAKLEARSQINLAVVSRYASEDPYKALDYYENNKEGFSGKDHITASALVNAARDQRSVDEHIARITGQGGAGVGAIWPRVEQAESGGNPNAESAKGAVGVSQILIPTAREVLTQIGRNDIAQLDDTQLKLLLKQNPDLNRQLGQTYLSTQLNKYDGDVEAALVAYNAGPGSADKWLAANAGKPPGQRSYDVEGLPLLKSETQPYVQKILGAQTGGLGVSTPPGYRMTRENWSLKNFSPEDLMAPTSGGQWVDARAAQGLDQLYTIMEQRFPGLNISVNEKGYKGGPTAGFRRGTADPADNPHVEHSQHLKGTAFDVQVQSWADDQKAAFITEARKLGFAGFGFYGPQGHLHIDMGNERTWGTVPEWAKAALGTPVEKGPGLGSGAAPAGSVSADDLPNTGQFFGMGAQTGGAFVSTKAPDLNRWLAEANLIADPGERARTKEALRLTAAQQEQDNKASVAALKQKAWDAVLAGGTKDLPIEVLSQLGPEFVSQLKSYETNRAKGSMPQDWKTWSDVSRMSDQELAAADSYTEFRNKLDDEHFDKLLQLQREARNKLNGQSHDEALLANTRTTGQIIDDIAAAQGWKKTNSNDATKIASLSQAMDQRILGEQAAKGQKLSSVEIQDIADKLLIEDQVSKFLGMGSAQGRAIDAKKPDEFIAASSWDEVQADDQKTLTNYYEDTWGKTPNQDEATDLYNRAMRVWLGGKPDGPESEQSDLRQFLETRLNRKLSDAEFESKYGKFLLHFLGR